jgi:hypothetical protein
MEAQQEISSLQRSLSQPAIEDFDLFKPLALSVEHMAARQIDLLM